MTIECMFELIKKIAERNKSLIYYNIELINNAGQMYITCTGDLFPEVDSVWLFAGVTREESVLLLKFFITNYEMLSWDLGRHFSRLLATEGKLIEAMIKPIIDSTDWSSYSAPSLFLSYLAVMPNRCLVIKKMFQVVPADCHEGLFCACWYCDDYDVHEIMRKKFEDLIKDSTWGSGDGGFAWLEMFLGKWISKHVFAQDVLCDLMANFFKHKFDITAVC